MCDTDWLESAGHNYAHLWRSKVKCVKSNLTSYPTLSFVLLLLKHHYHLVCAAFISPGKASDLNRPCKRDQEDFPSFPLTSSSPVLILHSPTVFLASHHFDINLFHRPSVVFSSFSSIQARHLFYLFPTAPLAFSPNITASVCLLCFFLGTRLCAIHQANAFYELNPFLTVCFQVWGQILIHILLLPHHSLFCLFTARLPLHNLSECIYLSIMAIKSYPGWDHL